MRRHIIIAQAAPALLLAGTALAADPETTTLAQITLGEVVVTAPPMEAPLTVVTDPKAPRQPVPPADGAGYLKQVPGFTVIRKGGSGGDPLLRGQGGSRLNILLDDTPLLGGCGGRMDPPTAYIFPESYDKITVIKGPQTVLHGPGNTAGSVIFKRQTKRFDALGYRGNASATVGSWGRNDQMLDVTGGGREGYVRAIGTRSEQNDYRAGDGNRVRSEYNRRSITGILGWTPDDTTLVEGTVDFSEARAAYADRMMDGPVFDRQGFKLAASKQALSPLVAEVKAEAYHNYVDHVMDRISLRPWSGGMMAALSNPDRTTTGGRTSIELTPTDATSLVLGVEHKRDRHTGRSLSAAQYLAGVDYRDLPRTPNMTFRNTGVFAQADHSLSADARVIGGLRFDFVDVTYHVTQREADHTLVSGFARYEHDLELGLPVTAFAGFGRAARSADWWERNRAFDLDPEVNHQLDLGVIHSGERLRLGASLFFSRYEDYILVQAATPTARNVDARMFGGEIEAGWAFTPALFAGTALSYVRGSNLTDGGPLPQVPPLELRANIQYDDGTYIGGLVMRAVASQERVAPGQGNIAGTDIGPSPGFAVFSVNAGFRPIPSVTLLAGVDNLFDTAYAEHVSKGVHSSMVGLGYEQTTRVLEPGRTFWLRGGVSF